MQPFQPNTRDRVPRKLNVHLVLGAAAGSYARTANASIRALADSVISFADASPMRPHITLVRGVADDREPTQEMQEALHSAIERWGRHSLTLLIEAPKYVADSGYVVADAAACPELDALIAEVRVALGSAFIDEGEVPAPVPHLTLARVEADNDDVASCVGTMPAFGVLVAHAVEISSEGPAGTCIDSFYQLSFTRGFPDLT